ncbi:MAG: hypothetical protein F9K40_10245 [Kofleriaceae bacterium]|nr:MAG: hypothetical protein F9K40_10245 [Kofleriaceae bacterium]
MTPAQRKSATNGIWLCQNHAKQIDDDPVQFTVEKLEHAKAEHEARIAAELRAGRRSLTATDEDILAALETVIDRPALYEPFAYCRNAYFGKAVSDVIEALNTGIHRLRDGTEIKRIPSRHQLKTKRNRDVLEGIVEMLGEARGLHASLVADGLIADGCGCTKTPDACAPLDDVRAKILAAFRSLRPTFARTVGRAGDPETRA